MNDSASRGLLQRLGRGQTWGLPMAGLQRLAIPDGPEAVQDLLCAMPADFAGDTCRSVQQVLQRNVATGVEAAFVAAAALSLQGRPPLLLRLFSSDGADHVIALFQHAGRWGAISQEAPQRCSWRDPVYQNLRELVMSYFHGYGHGVHKTLVGYCDPFDLRRIEPARWITRAGPCDDVVQLMVRWGFHALFDPSQVLLRPRDADGSDLAAWVPHGDAHPSRPQ